MSVRTRFHPFQHCAFTDVHTLTAGKECTAVFFGLHRQEILYNERYAKLVIGQIENEEQLIRRNEAGSLSQVPYAEPMWLTPGFKRSPYFKESHYAVQKGQSSMFDS